MNKTTHTEYWDKKDAFFKKHQMETVHTSAMNEYGGYCKTYVCVDGAQWFESMEIVPVTEQVTVRGVPVTVTVKLFRTEYWNTDDSGSYIYYESV
jgi:hypothetical protein